MHRSNNICPISAIWTVVCCVFDNAGFFIGVTYAGKNTPYTSLKISLLPPYFAGEPKQWLSKDVIKKEDLQVLFE